MTAQVGSLACAPTTGQERRGGGEAQREARASERESRVRIEAKARIAANTVRFGCPGWPRGSGAPPRREARAGTSPPTRAEGRASAAVIPPPHWSTRSTGGRSRDGECVRGPSAWTGGNETAVTTETRHGEHWREGARAASLSNSGFYVARSLSPSLSARRFRLRVSLRLPTGSRFNHLLLAPRHEPTSLG